MRAASFSCCSVREACAVSSATMKHVEARPEPHAALRGRRRSWRIHHRLPLPHVTLAAATACGAAYRSGMSSGKQQTASPPISNQGGHADGCHKLYPPLGLLLLFEKKEEGSPWLLPAWSDHRRQPSTVAATRCPLHLASSPYMRPCLAMSGGHPRRRDLAPMPGREHCHVAIRMQPSLHLKPSTSHRTWYVCLHVRTWIGSTLAATGCSPDYLRKLGRSR